MIYKWTSNNPANDDGKEKSQRAQVLENQTKYSLDDIKHINNKQLIVLYFAARYNLIFLIFHAGFLLNLVRRLGKEQKAKATVTDLVWMQ